jgi:hypothetical protein
MRGHGARSERRRLVKVARYLRLFPHVLIVDLEVKKVNLPDGTPLSVVLTDCGTAPVSSITLSRGEGQLFTALPQGCMNGR